MKISVIIPVWNQREDFFRETVESVLNQTREPDEIIIVDDGSEPPIDLDAIVKKVVIYDKTKTQIPLKFVRIKKNMGVAYSWNKGIKEAKGDIVCLLGSDDLWMPEKLEKQIKMAKKYPDYILHTNAIEINEEGKEIYEIDLVDYTPEEYKERAKQPYGFYYSSSFFIPKKIFDKVGFINEDLTLGEDYEWVLRAILLHNIKFKLVKDVLVKKRRQDKSISTKDLNFTREEPERIRKLIMEKMK